MSVIILYKTLMGDNKNQPFSLFMSCITVLGDDIAPFNVINWIPERNSQRSYCYANQIS